MDIATLHTISGWVSAFAQMAATVGVLFCVVSLFSYKPGGSTKFFYGCVTYFFLSYAVFFVSAIVLDEITGNLVFSGVPTLFMAALVHLVYGITCVVLYVRMVGTK